MKNLYEIKKFRNQSIHLLQMVVLVPCKLLLINKMLVGYMLMDTGTQCIIQPYLIFEGLICFI